MKHSFGGILFAGAFLGAGLWFSSARGEDFTEVTAPSFMVNTTKWFHIDLGRLWKTKDTWSLDYTMEFKEGATQNEHLATFPSGPAGKVTGDSVVLVSKTKGGELSLHARRLDTPVKQENAGHGVGGGDWEISVSGKGPEFEHVKQRLTQLWTECNKTYEIKVNPLKFPMNLLQLEPK